MTLICSPRPSAPNILLTRYTPTEAPEVVLVLNPGGPEGFPFFRSFRVQLRNTGAAAVTVYDTVVRAKQFVV